MTSHHTGAAIGKNAMWSVLNQATGQILSLVVFLITARFVSKADFGVMAIAMLNIEFFRQILIESVGTSLAAKTRPADEDYNASFIIILVGSVLAAGTMFLLSGPLSVFMKNPDLAPALRLTCLALLAIGLSRTHETWMSKNMKFKALAIRSILAVVIGGGTGIFMAIHGYGLKSLITQQILTFSLSTVFLWITCKWKPTFKTSAAHIKSLLSYAKHISMNAVAAVVGAQSDVFFTAYYLGPAATGIYNSAKRILLATQLMIIAGLNGVALPVFSDHADDLPKLRELLLKALGYTIFLFAPLYMGLGVLSNEVISVILGSKWAEVGPIISILSVSALIAAIDQYNINILLVRGKPHWQTFMTAINVTTNLLLLVLLARHGLHPVAWALVIKTLAMFPISIYMALKLCDMRLKQYLSVYLPSMFCTCLMGAVLWGVKEMVVFPNSIVTLLALIPLGGIIYLVFSLIYNGPFVMQIYNEAMKMIRGQHA